MRFYFHRQSFISWRYLGAVPAYLQPATQLEMRKILLPECLDRDTNLGCIYAIEIQSEGICLHILLNLTRFIDLACKEIQIKVGVAAGSNRGKYWDNHYRGISMRYIFPRDNAGASVQCYKWAKQLIDLELGDLAQHGAYLDPKFPHEESPPATKARKKSQCLVPNCESIIKLSLGTPDGITGTTIHHGVYSFAPSSTSIDIATMAHNVIQKWCSL